MEHSINHRNWKIIGKFIVIGEMVKLQTLEIGKVLNCRNWEVGKWESMEIENWENDKI